MTPEDRQFALGRHYRLGDDGHLERADSRPDRAGEVRFAFALFAKWLHRMPWEPDYEGAGWTAVMTLFRVEDRVSHPTCVADLEVTAVEVQTVQRAFRWFILTLHFAILESIKKMHSDLKEPVPASVLDWERSLTRGMEELCALLNVSQHPVVAG